MMPTSKVQPYILETNHDVLGSGRDWIWAIGARRGRHGTFRRTVDRARSDGFEWGTARWLGRCGVKVLRSGGHASKCGKEN